MSRRMKFLAAVGGALVLALGGAAIARATGAFDGGNSQPTGGQAENMKVAAPRFIGAGTANARAKRALDDGDSQLTGRQAERAKAAALSITGGGTVNAVERDSEDGATYEVEVTRKDGSTVDVRLDGRFELVVVDGDSESNDSNDGG
jgi:hypothetical protein